MTWRALCSDYDRTLTDAALQPHPGAMAALRRARQAGLRIVIISGRPLGFLQEKVPMADAIVAENGAIRWDAREVWRAPWPERQAMLDALRAAGVPHQAQEFDIIVSLPRLEPEELARLLGPAMMGRLDQVANVSDVMLLPRGVDKATGMLAALRGLGIRAEEAAAVGDGENDVVMVEAAGLGAAVANAVPLLKARAKVVLQGAYGDGVVELVDLLLRAEPARA
ncbi:MAG: Cof-type HAD-IIB family hydrolase [Halobacteriales archaeon]|nr:Cof-type HAD-IIB family hydrolase [Halobacteriales archaeon]